MIVFNGILFMFSIFTHNQGVPGSSPGGPTKNQAVTEQCSCFFFYLHTIYIQI